MENLGAAYWASDEGELATRIYFAAAAGSMPAGAAPAEPAPIAAAAAGGGAPAAEAPGPEGEQKLSKNALKKLKNGKADKPAKKKDANQWAVDPAKAAAKAAEKAAKAKADAERNAAEAAAQVATPVGEKKILTKDLASVYMPEMVESAWQEWWEASGFYSADAAAGEAAGPDNRFVIVIPPPNVTGSLHLGHALTAAIEDALTRWHRMKGDVTLYVPGTDHAGIATQSIVEKMLTKETGQTRHDLGREAFLGKVWEWKEKYGSSICNQIKQLGSSVDWSREAFTMDDKCSAAVVEAFCRFHEKGILFRDKRLINWSCRLKSAISDIEVDHEDIEGGTWRSIPGHTKQDKYQFGMFTEFAYKVEGSDGQDELVVATTRLETMLGDTAVAVHPDDPRYKHLHGKFLVHPFHPDRKIPVILDPILVDMELGTGAVKITPAHDPNDYECGTRHQLPFITIFTDDGKMNEEAAQFEGLMRFDARVAVEKALDEVGLLRKKYPKPMKLGFCSRSGDVIEPMIMPQWFVDCSTMAARSVAAVKEGKLKIRPDFHEKTWYQWLGPDNIRPWCVSRQLWWGHRIPAYFATKQGEDPEVVNKNSDAYKNRWVVARSEAAAREQAAKLLGVPASEVLLDQDEDVLDTWFSSGLFPFSVLGWPNDTPDLKGFFPTSLLETGLDILFFWVARMVMMSLELTDQLPFTDIYLHAMVRDKEGRKMSKSLGNVIDPLEVIHGCSLGTLYSKLESGNLAAKEVAKAKKDFELDFAETQGIPKCGADALRIGLLAYTVQGRDINLDIKRVVGYRNFCNKLWQGTRFLLGCFGDFMPKPGMASKLVGSSQAAGAVAAPRDEWVLHKLNDTVHEVTKCFELYEFGKGVQVLDSFFRGRLCDVYLELIKPSVYNQDTTPEAEAKRNQSRAVLWTCLDVYTRLLHPMCPFVTEELWQRLPGRGTGCSEGEKTSIMVSAWPLVTPAWHCPSADKRMDIALGAIEGARSLRADHGLAKKPAAFCVLCATPEAFAAMQAQHDDFATLSGASAVTVLNGSSGATAPAGWPQKIVSDAVKVFVDLASFAAAAAANQKGGGGGGGGGGGADAKEKQIAKLTKEAAKLAPLIAKLKSKLEDPAYLSKVPEATQAKDREKLDQYAKMHDDAKDAIAKLG